MCTGRLAGPGMNMGIKDEVIWRHPWKRRSRATKHADLDGSTRRPPIASATGTFTNQDRASIVDNRHPAQLARNAVFSLLGAVHRHANKWPSTWRTS